jgi:hypothetical protein
MSVREFELHLLLESCEAVPEGFHPFRGVDHLPQSRVEFARLFLRKLQQRVGSPPRGSGGKRRIWK